MLKEVAALCVDGAKVVDICEKGDKILEDEIAKVYKGKKMIKGIGHPATVSPSSYVTPYTPLKSEKEAERTITAGEIVKVQLGAQIDGFGTIVCDNIVVGDKISSREADLLLATYYANELLLRLLLPPGLFATSDEDKKAAASQKPYSQAKINSLLESVAKTYGTNVVESTTSWQFERNEIEGKKKIILSPSEGTRGEGLPEVGEVWGIEVGLSLGSGKVKQLPERATLHRRTDTKYGLKRDSSRKLLTEIVKKFGTFPFSLRQLEDERSAKVGVVECVRGGVVRAYEVAAEKDGEPVSRLFSTVGEFPVFRFLHFSSFCSATCIPIRVFNPRLLNQLSVMMHHPHSAQHRCSKIAGKAIFCITMSHSPLCHNGRTIIRTCTAAFSVHYFNQQFKSLSTSINFWQISKLFYQKFVDTDLDLRDRF